MNALQFKLAEHDDMSDVGYSMSTELGEDTSRWVEEIIGQFIKENPQLSEMISAPEIENIDDRRRDANGQMVVRNGEQVIQIPIIVREGYLAPMDVFLQEGQVYPLTEDRIFSVLSNTSMVDSLTEDSERGPQYRSEPGWGRTESLYNKQGSLQINDEQRAYYDTLLASNPNTLEKIAHYGLSFLDRIYHPEQTKMADEQEVELLAWQVERVGPVRYKVAEIRADGRCEEMFISGGEAVEYLKSAGDEGAMALTMADNNEVVTIAKKPTASTSTKEVGKSITRVGKPGGYTLYSPSFKPMEASVVTNVKTLDGKSTGKNLAILRKGSGHVYEKNIAGVQEGHEGWNFDVLYGHGAGAIPSSSHAHPDHSDRRVDSLNLLPSRLVSFLREEKGDHQATEPILIKDHRKVDGVECLTGVAGVTPVSLVFSENIKNITKLDRDSSQEAVRRVTMPGSTIYAIPRSYKALSLGSRVDTISDPEQISLVSKTAAQESYTPSHLYCQNGLYTIELGNEKRAELDAQRAELYLASLGVEQDTARAYLKQAQVEDLDLLHDGKVALASNPLATKNTLRTTIKPTQRLNIDNLIKRKGFKSSVGVSPAPKVAEYHQNELNYGAQIPEWYDESFGEQGQMPQEGNGQWGNPNPESDPTEAMTSFLELPFMTEDNIDYFVGQLPQLEKTSSLLAQMLIALRSYPDMSIISESHVRQALNHLEDIISGLQGVAD